MQTSRKVKINEEFHNLYSSENNIRVSKLRRKIMNLSCMDRRKPHIIFFIGKPEQKRPFGRLRSGREVDIKIDLEEIVERVRSELIWLSTGTSVGLL
jgi:hypothetical protein